jgi:hypothetical protein
MEKLLRWDFKWWTHLNWFATAEIEAKLTATLSYMKVPKCRVASSVGRWHTYTMPKTKSSRLHHRYKGVLLADGYPTLCAKTGALVEPVKDWKIKFGSIYYTTPHPVQQARETWRSTILSDWHDGDVRLVRWLPEVLALSTIVACILSNEITSMQRECHDLCLHKELRCPNCRVGVLQGNGLCQDMHVVYDTHGVLYVFYSRFKHINCPVQLQKIAEEGNIG